jgi:outer membrane protein assembly factor BamB
LTDGRLVEGLLEQSELRVIAIDEDPVRVNRLRDRLEALGMSGPRASAYIGTPGDFGLPRWFASLVVSEDWSRAGVSPGEAGSFFECLRPCGGVACLSGADGTALGVAAARADGEQFRISRREEWTFLERPGPLPGASDWTHEACDAGNTRFSRDRRVRAPLGVLWFGGAAGARSLYFSRYGDPATPRVVDGRMILHSPGRFTAVDIYTGVVLWQSRLPEGGGVSRSRSNIESGIKGLANGQHAATQASFVACPEAIYVAWGRKLFALDPATGGRVREYEVSPDPGHAEPPRLGHVWVVGGTLVVGAGYEDADPEPLFVDSDFAQMPAERLAALLATIAHWPRADQASAARGNEPDRSRAARGLNCLLDEPELETLIPSAFLEGRADDPAPETSVRDALEELKKERQRRSDRTPYVSIRYANRRFLEALWPGIEPLPVKKYYHNLYPWDGMATTQLIGIDIGSGRQLWRVRARRAFPQKGVSAGNGRVYFVDRADPDRLDFLERRGIDVDRSAEVIALDASDGRELWRQSSEFSGYRTLYSSDRDIVVLGSPFDPDPALWTKPRDQGVRYTAWRGEDGSPLWDKPLTVHRGAGRHRMWYDWFLYDDIIITESYSDTHSDHYGMDLGTGELLTRTSPLTGNRLDWGFRRTRGCGRDLACEQLVLFRSSMAGYYRIGDDGGTANLAGFRSGCKNSLIPAGGILNAPNFAQGCTCNYPVFTALALAHDPGVEAWAANDFAYDGGSVAQLGVNLGAPGDYRDDGGLLWLDVPSAGGPSPDVPVAIEPESDSIRWFYTHSARLGGEAPRRVGASGAEGVQSVRIQLNPAGGAKRRYTVRLVFSEPDALAPGERVFDVAMQNVTCLEGYDIFARAGGRNRAIEECVEPVEVEKDLVVTLKSVRGRPILCGIAVQAEDAVP